jgi:flagellar basal-body rod protein FlgF
MKEVQQVLSAMLGQEERIAQIANNLANVNTVGFKKQCLAFHDALRQAEQEGATETESAPTEPAANPAGLSWALPGAAYTDLSMGDLQTTGRSLDMAIVGEGFFQVEVEGERFYTRAGNFTLDAEGRLATVDGATVLDTSGREIGLNTRGGAPQVGEDGTILQDGATAGRVGIVSFEDPQQLQRRGNGLFIAPEGLDSEPVAQPIVRGGLLEGSNVNAIREMVDMIEIQRAYDTNRRVIQSIDEIASRRIEAANS